MFEQKESVIPFDINKEITKSFQNTNYSQWERQKPASTKPKKSGIKSVSMDNQHATSSSALSERRKTFLADLSDRKCSTVCNHKTHNNPTHSSKAEIKTKRQLKEEEDRTNILKTKILFARDHLENLKTRELDLIDKNRDLFIFISKTEKDANQTVDQILNKYEKYQEVLKTINKKHFEELKKEQKELDELQQNTAIELPLYESSSIQIEQELKKAQDLNKLLSIYKNQEYPEKLLQINNLKKKLNDINNLHNEEHESLLQMIRSEKEMMVSSQNEATKKITNEVSSTAMVDMHDSLKDMAHYNASIKAEIEFYKYYVYDLKKDIEKLELEIDKLKKDERKSNKNFIFNDIFKQRDICTPDMDVILDLAKK